MKITTGQLRQIIKEEVRRALRESGSTTTVGGTPQWSVESIIQAPVKQVSATIAQLVGRGGPAEFIPVAEAVQKWAAELYDAGSYDEVYEEEAREEISQELAATGDKGVLDAVMHTFFAGADWTDADEDEDELRSKYSTAFNVLDYHAESGRAESGWSFYEDEREGEKFLVAEPNVSGEPIWWDAPNEVWREMDDDTLVWP